MTKMRWKAFPHDAAKYDYAGAALSKHWDRLHRGDCEPYPDPGGLKKLVAACPGLAPRGPLEATAATLQEAWRAYHGGAFGAAVELGLEVGLLGYNVANKAAAIYATYLEGGDKARLALFQDVVQRAEALAAAAGTMPNAWYLHALALGRYSQGISVAKALAGGLGGKVKQSLDRAIALAPKHADAHIALGAYHAEVINKVGALIGGLTYGASRDAGVEHFRKALALNPHSAVARIEYANGLVMMFGNDRMVQATRLYEEAAACEPADAMERLDVELAKAELAD